MKLFSVIRMSKEPSQLHNMVKQYYSGRRWYNPWNGTHRLEFLLCTLTPEVQCFTFHRKHLIWRTKITKFWQNGNDSKQPYSCSILMKFLPKKARTYVVFCDYFKIFFEAQKSLEIQSNLSITTKYSQTCL